MTLINTLWYSLILCNLAILKTLVTYCILNMVLRDASASKNGIFEHPLPSSFSPSLLICVPLLFRPIPKIFCKLIVTSRTFCIFSYIWQNLSFQDKFYILIENWKCTLSLNIFITGVLFVDKTDKVNAWTIKNSVFRVSGWCKQAVETEKNKCW